MSKGYTQARTQGRVVIEPGQHVMVRDKRPTALTAWIPGVVVQQKGPLTYIVKVCDGKMWKRHIDHLRLSSPQDMQEDSAPYSSAPTVLPAARVDPSTPPSRTPAAHTDPSSTSRTDPPTPSPRTPTPPTRRYPLRIRHPIDRYADTCMKM